MNVGGKRARGGAFESQIVGCKGEMRLPRQTQMEKAIANLSAQIDALELAKRHLIEQSKKTPTRSKPRLAKGEADRSA